MPGSNDRHEGTLGGIWELRLAATDSTMEAAKRIAAGRGTFLVVADSQSAGRGTRGRAWQSPPGNIYLTLGLPAAAVPAPPPPLPIRVGLALFRTLAGFIDDRFLPSLRIKWPNDILIEGGKVGGALLETHGGHFLVGVGVNIAVAPPVGDGGRPSARLADYGMAPADRDTLLRGLVQALQGLLRPENAEEAGESLQAYLKGMIREEGMRVRHRPELGMVKPLELGEDGRLRVGLEDGASLWLVSDYLE